MQEIATKTGEIMGYIIAVLLCLILLYMIVALFYSGIRDIKHKKDFKDNLLKEDKIEELKLIKEYDNLESNIFFPWKRKNKK